MTTDTEIDISSMTMRERVAHFRMMTFQWAPYLSPYVYSLVLVERPGIGTMSVDMQGRMYFDPKFVETLTLEQGGYVVLHEAWHLILRHCHRSKDIIGPNPTARQRGRLNVAYDCVIWELMEAVAQHAPKIGNDECVTFHNLKARYPKLVRNLLPGQIYSLMLEQDEEEQKAARPPVPPPPPPVQDEDDDEEFDPDTESDSDDDWESEDEEQDESDDGAGTDGEEQEQDDGEEEDEASDDDEIGMPARSGEEDTDDSGEGDDGDGDTEADDGDPQEDGPSSGDSDSDGEEDGPPPKFEDLSRIDDGSCSDGVPRDYEEEPNDNWDTFIEDQLLEQVEQEVEKQEQQGRGNVPGCLKTTIKEKLHPAPNPWDRLRAAVSLAAANPRGRPDFTYQRPNRRQFAMPDAPRLKGQTKYAPKACVIVDTSGSMTSKCLAKALVVIQQGLKALGKVPVITCDARVTKDVVLTAFKDDFELVGGGGTDMRIPIAYCEKKYRPDTIVLVTDTDTPWPDKPTKGQLIVAATRNGYVPKWATTVRIPGKEGE